MALLKIFNGYAGGNADPLEVKDVRLSFYRDFRIEQEKDELVLLEVPDKENNNNKITKEDQDKLCQTRYDLVVKNNRSKDYAISLRRFLDATTGNSAFDCVESRLNSLLKLSDSFPSREVVKNFFTAAMDHPSWTIAHLAVSLNLLDVLRSSSMQNFVNEPSECSKQTPLLLALEVQNLQATQILVDQGARADVVDRQDNSPFHYVVRNESKSLCEIVSKASGASSGLNQRNKEGLTPLQAACLNGTTSCVDQLLRLGADVNSASYSMKTISPKKTKWVPEKDIGMYSERQMRRGGTPLHWVRTRASLEMMIDVGCDVNATNSIGQTALHVTASKRRLDSLIWLLIESADVNFRALDGDTPLHVAVRSVLPPRAQDKWMLFKQKVEQKNYRWQKNDGLPIVQILLAFGADCNSVNNKGETPRHIAAVMASDSHMPRLDQLLFILHAVGAKRCVEKTTDCTSGCSPDGDFDGVPPADFCREKIQIFDGPLSKPIFKRKLLNENDKPRSRKRCRALSVDGGGVKGLVTLRTLKCLEEVTNVPLFQSFDWVMGTSAGGITTLCLAAGHSVDEVFRSAYRLKEKFIVGPRPYDTDGVEAFFKNELGENTKMKDIQRPRVAITAVNAESWPTRLKLFRNYSSPRSLLENKPEPADDEHLWCAARATGAAPTFFKPYKNYLDGALICNNPTLDLITEITEHNAAMEDNSSEQFEMDVLVSVGGGMRPTAAVSTIDALQLDPGIFSAARVAYSVGHLMKFAVEQISEPDGRHVDRARAWCYGIGVPFARLQPALSQAIPVNESDNRIIAKILWETMAFFREHADELKVIAKLLKDDEV